MMNQVEMYKAAIGGRHQDYYLKAFERIDNGEYFAMETWNWGAFFFGPLWHSYRRIGGVLFTMVSTSICIILIIPVLGIFLAPFNFLIGLSIYSIGFPVLANLYYHHKVNDFINNHRELSDLDLKKLLVARFQTTIDHANRAGGIIK